MKKVVTATYLVVLAGALPYSVYGQSEESAKGTLDEIVVVGTRRADRTVLESTVPVDVFRAEDLKRQGSSTDTNDLLRTLIPSFSMPRIGARDTGSFIRAPTLRGLPPDSSLVLVNGKRFHRSALVQLDGDNMTLGAQGSDMAQIPAIAIERVEVLRDGAAAQYGSDAIAGVINFTLKRQRKGVELDARYGKYYMGDGTNLQFAGNVGLPLGENGFLNISADFTNAGRTSRGGIQPALTAEMAAYPDLADQFADAGRRKLGDPRQRTGHIFANGGIDLGAGELYFFGNYGHAEAQIDFIYRASRTVVGPDRFGTGTQTFGRNGVFRTIFLDPVAPGSSTYDVNGQTFSFESVFPYGFVPKFHSKNEDMSAAAGYKGKTASGLNYDVSATWGRNELGLNLHDTVNPSLGPDSPTSFYIGNSTETDKALNLDLSYPVDVGLASPITLAGGAEWRNERYAFGAGDPASYVVGPYAYQILNGENPDPDVTGNRAIQSSGTNGFPGHSAASAVDKGRSSYAAYLDVAGDVGEKWSFDLATRYEHFADFGSTTNSKISARYAIAPGFALRGAASTGFRAPTSGQLFAQSVQTLYIGSDLTEIATLPPTDAASRYFGAQALKPEKSENYSLGAVFTLGQQFYATFDLYQIDVRDRIGISGRFTVTAADRDPLRTLGVANWATLGRVQYFTNAFATRTRGVDLVANHAVDTEHGRFNTALSLNYNATKVTSRNPVIVNDLRKGNMENILPKVRGSLTEIWSKGKIDTLVRVNYAGSFTEYADAMDGGNKRYSSQVPVDLEVTYKWNKSLHLSVGAQNVFDSYPDDLFRAIGTPNQNLYVTNGTTLFALNYPDAPFGYDGGFWYVRASYRY